MGDGRSRTEEISREGDRAVIDDYLKKVEKDLKGFSREAKDSILTEIEGHIKERSSETGERGEGDRIQTILDDLGHPEAISAQYSPILEDRSAFITWFRIYSLIASLFTCGYALSIVDFSQFKKDWDFELIEVLLIIALPIATVNILLLLFRYHDRGHRERTAKFHSIANGYLGTPLILYLFLGVHIVLDMTFDIPGNVFIWELDEYYAPWFHEMELLTFVLGGILSFHISSIGHSRLFCDTADGVARLRKNTFVLFPVILVFDLWVLTIIGAIAWRSFDQYFLWLTFLGYVFIVLLTSVAIIIAALILIRRMFTYRLVLIDKWISSIFFLSMIIVYSIFGSLYLDTVALTEDSEDLGYFGPYLDFPYSPNIFIHNGSVITLGSDQSHRECRIVLNRYDRTLEFEKEIANVSVGVNTYERYCNLRDVLRQGSTLHLLYSVNERVRDDEGKFEYLLITISLDGELKSSTNFIVERNDEFYENTLVVQGSSIHMFFYDTQYNTSTYANDLINITKVTLTDGQVTEINESFMKINVTRSEVGMDRRLHFIRMYPGDDSISLLLKFDTKEYDILGSDRMYTRFVEVEYFTRISLDGTVLIPLVEISNTTQVSWQYRAFEDSTVRYFYHIANDVMFFSEYRYNQSTSSIGYSSFDIHPDGSIERTDYLSDYLKNFSLSYPSYYEAVSHDDQGNARITIIAENVSQPGSDYYLIQITIDPNGTLIELTEYPLSSLKFFTFLRKLDEQDRLDDLYVDSFIEHLMFDPEHNATILTIGQFIDEEESYVDTDLALGANFYAVLEIQGDNLTVKEYGPNIRDEQARSGLYLAYGIGILFGLTIPAYLWILLRRGSEKGSGKGTKEESETVPGKGSGKGPGKGSGTVPGKESGNGPDEGTVKASGTDLTQEDGDGS